MIDVFLRDLVSANSIVHNEVWSSMVEIRFTDSAYQSFDIVANGKTVLSISNSDEVTTIPKKGIQWREYHFSSGEKVKLLF